MNIKKEDVVLFFRQNVKSIILAFVCSLVVIIGGLFYFNQSKALVIFHFKIISQVV